MFKNKWWIFLVLASFSFLLVPKGIWHHCEDEHSYVSHKDPKQKYFENGDCSVCDFQLFTADIHYFPAFTFQKATHLQFDSFAKDQHIVYFRQLSLRGPPQEMV